METKTDTSVVKPKRVKTKQAQTTLQDTASPVLSELLAFQTVLKSIKSLLPECPENYTVFLKKIDELEGASRVFQSKKELKKLENEIENFLPKIKSELGDLTALESTLARLNFNLLGKILKDTVPLARDFKEKVGYGKSEVVSPVINDFIEGWHEFFMQADGILKHLRANQHEFNQSGLNTGFEKFIKLGEKYQRIMQRQLSKLTVSEPELDFLDEVFGHVNSLSDSVVTNLEQAQEIARKAGKEFIDDAEKTATELRDKIEEKIESVTDELKHKAEEFAESGTEFFENLDDAKKELVQDVTEKLESVEKELQEVRDNLLQTIEEKREVFEEKREAFVNAITPELNELEKIGSEISKYLKPSGSLEPDLLMEAEETKRKLEAKLRKDIDGCLRVYNAQLAEVGVLIDDLQAEAATIAEKEPKKAGLINETIGGVKSALDELSCNIADGSVSNVHQMFRDGIVDKKLQEVVSTSSKVVDKILPEVDEGLQQKFMLLLLAILDVVTLTLSTYFVDAPVAFTESGQKLANFKTGLASIFNGRVGFFAQSQEPEAPVEEPNLQDPQELKL